MITRPWLDAAISRPLRGLAVFVAVLLGLCLRPEPAQADRPLPSWTHHEARSSLSLGWRALARGNAETAIESGEHAATLTPGNPGAWILLARGHELLQDWEAARTAVTRAVELAPRGPEPLLLLGRIEVELGAREAALASFEQASTLTGAAEGALLGRALVSARLDRNWTEVAAHLLALIEKEPDISLSTLPLSPPWRPLADDPKFIDTLESVLREAAVSGDSAPSGTKEPPRR